MCDQRLGRVASAASGYQHRRASSRRLLSARPFRSTGPRGLHVAVCASEIEFKTSEANEEQSRTAFDQHTVL